MQHRNRLLLTLLAVITMVGSLALVGCPGDDDDEVRDATGSDLANRSFTFASGTVFDPALTESVTLSFLGANAGTFTLSSASGSASGTNTISSCNLAILESSYPAAQFPRLQVNRTIPLDPCEIDTLNNTLIITNTDTNITAISNPGIPTGTGGGGS